MPNLNFLPFFLLITLCNSLQPYNYGQTYNFTINKTNEQIMEFTAQELKLPPRVTIQSQDAQMAAPLMVVARQPKELVSWQLPLILEGDAGKINFTKTSRTLCHDIHQAFAPMGAGRLISSPIVSVATASETNVSFTIRVDYEVDFIIEPSVPFTFTISPSEPRYYFYNFTTNTSEAEDRNSNYDTVILEVHSSDTYCMTVSIQNASCPIFDTNEDITFRGFWETVNKQGGITIPKYKFPLGFYAVFVAKPDDSDCVGFRGTPVTHGRTKNITLTIKPSITYHDYVNAVIATMCGVGAFYFIFYISFFLCSRRSYVPRQMDYVHQSEPATPSTTCADVIDDLSVDGTDYDPIAEAETDRSVRLGKPVLYLSDLARKDPRIHKYKSYLYLYNVLTVALFYGLPVVQLVITYQKVLNETGEQDLCYYNFLCAHPLGFVSDFNHVFSNVGYVTLGFLFLWLTYRREITHKDLDFDRQYGIPQHYGMFYAMGVALIMEGVLSGSYHICPNTANFQFDSSFMYVMVVLCMVKLYQNRHPDINATACATFMVLALAILLGMVGILDGNLTFWICFTVIYVFACLYLSVQIYYMGCWKLDSGLVRRVFQVCVYDFWAGPLNVLKPLHQARMCLLVVANLCNWGLAFWGVYRHQKDFALFLLTIFMANTLLYFCFYIAMKYVNKERVNRLSLLFLSISSLCAISAMYFFLNKSISWSKTPAESRWYNQECKLLRFYDFHDIWHFLSAIGMFFMFMVLLTLDDDLSHTHRSRIIVF